MFLRFNLSWLIHARRLAFVVALLSIGETVLLSNSTKIAQTQSTHFFYLPVLSTAHAKDDSRRRALKERLHKIRQKRQDELRRRAQQKQQAQQRRQAQRRRAEQRQQAQQRRQAQRRRRAEQKQQAQQRRQAQRRKRAEKKQQAQQPRQAQRQERAEQKQQVQQPHKAQRRQVPQEKRLTQQGSQPSIKESAHTKPAESEIDEKGLSASQGSESEPSTSQAVAATSDDRAVSPEIDGIPEKPPGFDVMDPPFTLVEMVKQISQPKKTSPKANPVLPKPYRPAASALGAPPAEVEATPVVPLAITPTPVDVTPPSTIAATPVSKSQKRPSRRNKGRPVPLSEIVVPMLPPITPRELLATNVAPSTLKRALGMGFQVASSQSYSGLGMSITRLVVPASMSEVEARRVMQTNLREGSVGFNHTYRLYRTAMGNDEGHQSTTNKSKATCVVGDCDGRTAIGWTKKLDSCVKGIKIGVIDTGIDAEHPAFSGRQIEFATTVFGKKPLSPNNHGTGILSLLAGSPKSGVNGLIPSARFVISDVFFKDRDGFPITDTISLLNALELMEKRSVAVVNLSIAGPKDKLIEDAIAKLSKAGMIFIAAAGNGGPAAGPSYPAAYKQVIAVTAVGTNLRAFRYANHGEYIDIAAPGVRIWTAQPNRKYGLQTGTSFAVPYVTAAVAAIYRSLPVKTRKGALKRLSVLDLGAPGKDQIYGNGMMVAPQDCSPATDSWSTSVQQEPIDGVGKSRFASR